MAARELELLIIRHGEATPVGSPGVGSDRERTLSATGVDKTKRAAAALNRLGIRLNAVLTSPYPRAHQTAEILCERLERAPQLRACDALSCDADMGRLMEELNRVAELKAVGVCGHEPDLSRLTARLLANDDRPRLVFHTGSMAYMHVELNGSTPSSLLHWFLDSRQLDWIAQAP